MEAKRCAACGKVFQPSPHTPHQTYCSLPDCQRARRRQWQQEKLKADPDYRDNQVRAQKAWAERNRDYWRKYRNSHPEYVAHNRDQQRYRNAARQRILIAKIDAGGKPFSITSGVYEMRHASIEGNAKKNAWIVEVRLISRSASPSMKIAKR